MKRKEFETETELASALMAHLEELGWDCYPEAAVNRGGNRADIIAYRKPIVWVIEAKLRFGQDVLDQARNWLNWAHYVSVLVPSGGRWHSVLTDWMKWKGVGLIEARKETAWGSAPPRIDFDTSRITPRLHRSAHRNAQYIAEHLHPDMKRFAPGTNAGYSSPWRRTMNAAIHYVQTKPGCTIREIVENASHHYQSDASARSCLLKWLEADPRVSMQREGRVVKLYPAAAA